MSKFVLSIDQGTTGTMVMLFDREGRPRGQAYREHRQIFPQAGWVEHDAREIWNVTAGLISQALAAARAKRGDVAAVGITNQRETVVLWDRKTGEPVGNAIVWQDRRTADFCGQLKERGLEPLLRKKTGLVADPYFSASKIRWLLQQGGTKVRTGVRQGRLAAGTMDSWLIFQLTGGKVHATDVSNASRTMLFNIGQGLRDWDEELLKIFGIPREILPEVVASSGVLGETKAELTGGASVPIAGVAGDQQASLFGQACYGQGTAKNTYGTGCFILMNTGKKRVVSKNRLLTTVAWQLGEGDMEYALEGSVFVTGAAVQWLRDGLRIIEKAQDTEALATSLAGNEGVYVVPALTGLGAPWWDAYARGMIIGLTRGTTRAHIARAVLESMAYQTRDVVEAMQRDSGVKLKELRVDGGAVGNRFLMQFQADMLGVPVCVAKEKQTTALGAAYLAGLAVGFWKDRKEIDERWRPAKRYEPGMKEKVRAELYGRWLEAVERARGWEMKSR